MLFRAFLVLSLLWVLAWPLFAQAAPCDCAADIRWISEKIEQTPAYKRHKKNYQAARQAVLRQAESGLTTYECYTVLNRLLMPLNDWHAGVYGPPADDPGARPVAYPHVGSEVDKLVAELRQKAPSVVEGIYRNRAGLALGIVYRREAGLYQGIILESPTDDWQRGDVLYQYLPLTDEAMLATGAQFPGQRLISYREKVHDGILLTAGLQKDTTATLYRKPPDPDETYQFRALTPTIDYLRVGSFTGQYPTLREAEAFYASLDGRLTKEHLVLDLRSNGGGGNRNSNLLLKRLKRFLRKGRLYVLINFSTSSNAEQFALKLKRFKNVVLLGDRTKGALAYEIKPGDFHVLPCTGFSVVLTSKRHRRYQPYETVGVAPDHEFDYRESWLRQVRAYIEAEE